MKIVSTSFLQDSVLVTSHEAAREQDTRKREHRWVTFRMSLSAREFFLLAGNSTAFKNFESQARNLSFFPQKCLTFKILNGHNEKPEEEPRRISTDEDFCAVKYLMSILDALSLYCQKDETTPRKSPA